jgi:uncharacterized SAM-binding protein YcdF (DUF218 family)
MLLAQAILLVATAASLPFAGHVLYEEDPLERADAVFVLAGERVIRWLEASDLMNEGWAPRALLSAGYREAAERGVIRRGVTIPSEGDVARNALLQLGHAPDAVEVAPGFPDNTAAEGQLLRAHAVPRGWTRVIVVTSKLHTQRAAFAIRRELEGSGIKVIMRASRYDDDDPTWWWTRRRTIRTLVAELPKLVAYVFGLGA